MLITNESYEYLKAYNFYEKQMLPFNIAWTDQPNKFIQAMILLENEYSRWRNKRIEDAGPKRSPKTR